MNPDPLIYRDEDFPMGLRCAVCSHLFAEGEPISQRLDSFQEDIPMTTLVCVPCAIGRRHDSCADGRHSYRLDWQGRPRCSCGKVMDEHLEDSDGS